MILDLRFNGNLNPAMSHLFNDISYKLRGQFNNLISEFSGPLKYNLDWLVEGPASRNTMASPFFHYYCCLYFVNHLIKNENCNLDKIIVDSNSLQKLLIKITNDNYKVVYKLSILSYFKEFLKRHVFIFILLVRKLFQLFIAMLSKPLSSIRIPNKPITLIDTFVIPGYTTNDRWYTGLWDNLADQVKIETFFVPTIVMTPLKDLFSTYKDLRTSDRNFLIKEDYLKIEDILFALGHVKRTKKIIIKPINELGCDISELVYEELNSNRALSNVIEALLNYCFIKRMKENGINVRLAIDWFEGQVFDRGWNLGFKKFYPEVKRIGYRAFESFPFYLCSYPIPIEKEAGVLPDSIAVTGRGTITTVREFFSDLDVMVIPSFKSQHVWKNNSLKLKNETFTILVALPISLKTSVNIIDLLKSASESTSMSKQKLKFIIKAHPTNSVRKIRESFPHTFPPNLVFSEQKSFHDLLVKTNLLVTAASSTCLEALACGLPVIIIENVYGLTYNPVPNSIPNELYKICSSPEQLISAFNYYMNVSLEDIKKQKEAGKRIREEYFEPVTEEGVMRFLDLGERMEKEYA